MSVDYNHKIRIQDLPLISQISEDELTSDKYNVEVSYKNESSTNFLTGKYSILKNLAAQHDILAKSAAKRYWTEDNELIADDLTLFSRYSQTSSSQKEIYFEKHPIIDEPNDNNMLDDDQLLTKSNIEDFEAYLSNKKLIQYSLIPVFNWENEWSKLNKDNVDECIQDTISGVPEIQRFGSFENILDDDKHEARATYKFLYTNPKPNERNPERVTNIVPLNNMIYESASNPPISGVVHLSVAGYVSVKTDLPNQESGTIYLEARRANKNTIDNDNPWQTIDSSVFKFNNSNSEKKSPGTFITLNGYLTTEFETRLKLNLKSNAYSMNIYEYRETADIPVTHYVNTFIGIVHIPNIKSTPPDKIYFTNINYQPYLYRNMGLVVAPFQARNGSYRVSDILSWIYSDNPTTSISSSIKYLQIKNTPGVDTVVSDFQINGLRVTPTGKIYGLEENMPIHAGMTIYPSYTSGAIDVKKPDTFEFEEKRYPTIYNWDSGKYILNQIDFDEMGVLEDVQWPEETLIYAKISATANVRYNTYKSWTTGGVTSTSVPTTDTINVPGTYSATDYATEKPRRQYHGDTTTINFSKELKDKTMFGDITCTFTAKPSTWGSGDGNESYGIVRSGTGSIVNRGTLSTKNVSKTFTKHLCTGSRWNYSAATITGKCIQPCSNQKIKIEAYADTAKDDGKDRTYFSVSLYNLKVTYNCYVDVEEDTTEFHEEGGVFYYSGNVSADVNCSISSQCIYPKEITATKMSESSTMTSGTLFNDISASFNYENATTGTADHKNKYTTLTVCPFPQNLIF